MYIFFQSYPYKVSSSNAGLKLALQDVLRTSKINIYSTSTTCVLYLILRSYVHEMVLSKFCTCVTYTIYTCYILPLMHYIAQPNTHYSSLKVQ
jgi:hypothetical protein